MTASSDVHAVECRGLTRSFGAGDRKVVALRGIDLTVRTGELTLLLGPPGCGKTTLVSVIAGILAPDQGQCLVFGADARARAARLRLRKGGATVGFVFQAFNLQPSLTAAENVAVPLRLQRVPRPQALERARDALVRLGLGDRTTALPSQLSGCQQQCVAIARALVHEPRLVVCDEPTSALDHRTAAQVMDLFRSMVCSARQSVLVATRDPRIVSEGDRIARMEHGRIQEVTGRAAMQEY